MESESASVSPSASGRTPVRVVLVEDHPLFRTGLRSALESAEDVVVVGEAETLAGLAGAVEQGRPQVVVMDLSLPDGSGLEATRRLAEEHPGVSVLVLTMADDDGTLLAALHAGARGYLLKGAGRQEVLHAVRAVAAGGAVFGPDVAARIAVLAAGGGRRDAERLFPALTGREVEVLDLVARGYDNRRVSRELFLAEKTVRNHVTRIFEKLGVTTRAEAVVRARDAGLGTGDTRGGDGDRP
ncbi:response regulator transcription factor [Streptomyces lavendulae]|uniref:response regulator transcription factor n=1 Tax=Streptomyces lavendulae TaxID=1914 RepID=UPI0024A360BE|nr:response regulator transcription factor [Streptomyces lavendulae]GLX22077.1 DNA-binding response regulator [Streptomyces lavendulae subsp. lavendulae]GLX29785.1 DNA-binding response regulator [Streptomyces lavendulae subsp. lavendulae]